MKILWAVDIFEKHPKAVNASKSFLQSLSKRIQIKVDAISVVFPVEFDMTPTEESSLKTKKIKLLNSTLKSVLKKKWFGKSFILLESQIPQRVAVMDLVDFAKENDYDAILLVKHSYKTHRPFYLGSFAEMTAFLSSIPIFLINPDGIVANEIERIIVALDENSKKEKEFKEVMGFIPVKDLNVKVFHGIRIPFYYLSKESIKQYIADQKRIILKSFQSIIRICENVGGIVDLDVKSTSKKIDESILLEAKKGKFDLIVTIHRKNEIQGYLLGRTIRRVLQNADRPVLLFRP